MCVSFKCNGFKHFLFSPLANKRSRGVRPCDLLTLEIKKYSAWLVVIPEWKDGGHSTEVPKFPGSATICFYNKAKSHWRVHMIAYLLTVKRRQNEVFKLGLSIAAAVILCRLLKSPFSVCFCCLPEMATMVHLVYRFRALLIASV